MCGILDAWSVTVGRVLTLGGVKERSQRVLGGVSYILDSRGRRLTRIASSFETSLSLFAVPWLASLKRKTRAAPCTQFRVLEIPSTRSYGSSRSSFETTCIKVQSRFYGYLFSYTLKWVRVMVRLIIY